MVYHRIGTNNLPARLSQPRRPGLPPVRQARSRSAFSLIELLIVCGILVVLLALLLPLSGKVRQKAIEVVCACRLRDLTLASQAYATNNEGRFPLPAADGQATVVPNLLP